MSGRGWHRHDIRQEAINRTALFLIFFLTVSTNAFGVMTFDPANVSMPINLTSGRVYLSYSSTPSYDVATDTYLVPAVIGEEVSAPDPVTAAHGDATPKTKIVGNPIVLKIPGTDLVKLADGTYTNVSPSSSLSNAYDSATIPGEFIFNDNYRVLGPSSGPCNGATDATALGFYFTNNSPYNQRIYDHTPFMFFVSADVTKAIAPPSSLTVGDKYFSTGSFIGSADSLASKTGCTPDHYYIKVATNGTISGSQIRGVDAYYYWSKDNAVVRYRINLNSGNVQTVTSNDILTQAPPTPPNSGQLGAALAPSLPTWQQNSLDDDFQKAAKNGTPAVDGLGPTPDDIDNWKLQNQSDVEKLIPTGLGPGSGPDENRPCGNPGGQGP